MSRLIQYISRIDVEAGLVMPRIRHEEDNCDSLLLML